MQVGIVGLPNVGKSTLFNALTKATAQTGLYPFTTKSSNVGIAEVPDERLQKVASMFNPKKVVPTHVKFVDIAGLVKGASKGEGLGNRFLSFIREVEIIAHVVRCFKNENVPHVHGKVDPKADIETISLELMLADLEMLERRLEKVNAKAKSGEKEARQELEVLEKIKTGLNQGIPARLLDLKKEELLLAANVQLLTFKPLIYVANVSEDKVTEAENELVKPVQEIATQEKTKIIIVSSKIEAEIAELKQDDAQEFLKELGLKESGLNHLIKESYKLLGLITFYTVGPDECRAWTVKSGAKAPEAAGQIHSDIERGFIKAEVVGLENLVKDGSLAAAREKGHLSIEGKDYTVQDADVIEFKFAV